MAFTLIAADGGEVGDSLVERDRFDEVRAARARAAERGVLIELPAGRAWPPRRSPLDVGALRRCRPPRSRAG